MPKKECLWFVYKGKSVGESLQSGVIVFHQCLIFPERDDCRQVGVFGKTGREPYEKSMLDLSTLLPLLRKRALKNDRTLLLLLNALLRTWYLVRLYILPVCVSALVRTYFPFLFLLLPVSLRVFLFLFSSFFFFFFLGVPGTSYKCNTWYCWYMFLVLLG